MPQLGSLLAVAALLFAGCATPPKPVAQADEAAAVTAIRARVDEVFEAAARQEFDRLDGYHLYGPKFTKFPTPPLGREDAEAARKGEHDGLAGISDLSLRADGLKIDVFGDAAIATFILDSSYAVGGKTTQSTARGTLVFVNDHGSWKIAHEHFSPFQPGR